MPNLNYSIEFIEKILEKKKNVPIIMITAAGEMRISMWELGELTNDF